jgi:hypothetical protein
MRETRKMENQNLPLRALEVENSEYRLNGGVSAESLTSYFDLLGRSIKSQGLLSPLVVVCRSDGRHHLVDGFKRAIWADRLGLETVTCRVLPEASIAEILDLVVISQHDSITRSAASRARFIRLAKTLGAPRDLLTERCLPAVGLEAHDAVRKRCLTVGDLPPRVLAFCEEKRLSMKQCANLARHPTVLLEALFDWKENLALTASITEELLDNMGDYIRAHNGDISAITERDEIGSILASPNLGNGEKTARLRACVRALRFPILTEVNGRMDSVLRGMAVPETVRVTWDRTLERKQVGVSIFVKAEAEWPRVLEKLTETGFSAGLGALLKSL